MLEKLNLSRDIFLIILVLLISNFFLIINNGIYWDTWTVFNETYPIEYVESGKPYLKYFFDSFLYFNNYISIMRISIFGWAILSALTLRKILSKIKYLSKFDIIWITLIFAVFPVNNAVINLSILNYPFTVLLFYLGILTAFEYQEKKKPLFRLLSLLLFFCSFTTNSILSYYAIAYILLFLHSISFNFSLTSFLKNMFNYSIKKIDFFLLPFIFFLIRKHFWTPFGSYSGYNSISLSNLKKGLIYSTYPSFYQAFVLPILECFKDLDFYSISIFVFTFTIVFNLFNIKSKSIVIKKKKLTFPISLLTFGLFAFFFSVFPYRLVLKPTDLQDWFSRHQLLTPFPCSLILYSTIRALPIRQNFLVIVLAGIVSIMSLQNIRYYLWYQVDHAKQITIIDWLKNNNEVKYNTSFYVEDNSRSLNANNRAIRYYEYAGYMQKAFGNQKRFAIEKSDYPNFTKAILNRNTEGLIVDGIPNNIFSRRYLMGEHKHTKPTHYITIEQKWNPSFIEKIGLTLKKYLNPEEYKKKSSELIDISIKEVDKNEKV